MMTSTLIRKELLEIRRTWRFWVLPGLLLIFGLTSPVLAELTPELVKSFAADQPGTVIVLPDPVPVDAYRQLASSLSQIVLIALIIASADLVSGEVRRGTAVLVLTKPVSRTVFVLTKAIVQFAQVLVCGIAAAAICWIGTRLIFGSAPVVPLVWCVLVWLVFAALVIAAAMVLSVKVRAQAGSAGIALAGYAALALIGQWQWAGAHTPAGLFHEINRVLDSPVRPGVWPIATSLAVVAFLLAIACWSFERAELSGGE